MPETFIKPENYLVQSALKVLKTQRSDAHEFVPNLLRAAAFPNNTATAAWSGDIYHRLGEWMARQGQLERPIDYFEMSLSKYHPSEALGPARVYRDYGMLRVSLGQHDEGFALFDSACWYHERDRKNDKGQRQRRVTDAYVLEARVLSDDRSSTLDELIELALFDCRDFCLRDQLGAVDCALLFARGADKRALHVRQLQINAQRRHALGTATSMAQVVIDKELQVAGHVIGSLLRKEWPLPRPW
jgi:hypothetical protein